VEPAEYAVGEREDIRASSANVQEKASLFF